MPLATTAPMTTAASNQSMPHRTQATVAAGGSEEARCGEQVVGSHEACARHHHAAHHVHPTVSETEHEDDRHRQRHAEDDPPAQTEPRGARHLPQRSACVEVERVAPVPLCHHRQHLVTAFGLRGEDRGDHAHHHAPQ